MSDPCFRCGAAGPCRHRPDADPVILPPPPKPDGRHDRSNYPHSGGWNFHKTSAKKVNSLRGRLGNPTKKQFEKLIRK